MTIVVAYAPRPEGQAALEKGIEIAQRRNEHLLVVNATPGNGDDDAMAGAQDVERIEALLAQKGLNAEFKQYGRGKSAVEEIETLVATLPVSLLIIGIRKRSPVGKLIMGSVAQELLLSVACPVLAVKATS
ncbi:universal stress protein [Rhodoferax sp. UBA5149]|uniref:universal stress protein n=1 Tax=Rhodoferax sp. UBA5149 TaxID=1947379 RepID=UPI0025D056BF|nr:universal stress protein [Rhodoferax sp. UBA5149]